MLCVKSVETGKGRPLKNAKLHLFFQDQLLLSRPLFLGSWIKRRGILFNFMSLKLRIWTDNINRYQHSCLTFDSIYFACQKSKWEKGLEVGNKETYFIQAMLLVNMDYYRLRMIFRILSSLYLSLNQAKVIESTIWF